MNREIKFRGKNIKGEWNFGLLCCDKTKDSDYEYFISNSNGKPYAFGAVEITIGQFTGLKDDEDNEIYEGDILEYKNEFGKHKIHKIFYKAGGLCFNVHSDDIKKDPEDIYFYEACADMQSKAWISQCKIIGNIHENPELLC